VSSEFLFFLQREEEDYKFEGRRREDAKTKQRGIYDTGYNATEKENEKGRREAKGKKKEEEEYVYERMKG
jgi:hypothetical protein